METPDGKIVRRRKDPPQLLELFVRILTPSAFRYVAGDLAERYRGPLPYLKDAAQTLPRLMALQAGRGRLAPRAFSLAWLSVGAAALLAGVEAIPVSSAGRDFWLGVALIPAFAAAFRSGLALAAILLYPLLASAESLLFGEASPDARPFLTYSALLLVWMLLWNRIEAESPSRVAER